MNVPHLTAHECYLIIRDTLTEMHWTELPSIPIELYPAVLAAWTQFTNGANFHCETAGLGPNHFEDLEWSAQHA